MERGGRIVEKPKSYTIDAEIGRLKIAVFEIRRGSEKVFSTRKDVFPEIASKEAFKTPCLLDLILFFPVDETFRKSTTKINRVLWRSEEDAIQFRTVANTVEREGELIQEHIRKKAEEILEVHGFSAEGKRIDSNKGLSNVFESPPIAKESTNQRGEYRNVEEEPQNTEKERINNDKGLSSEIEPPTIAEEVICKAIEDLNAGKEKELQIDLSELHETFEDEEYIKANISLDDVLAKKQKESKRKKDSKAKEKKEFVKNTVGHLQTGENAPYILNASCIERMMILVLAFLLNNGLLSRAGQLIFFIDGAADLQLAIQNLFFGLLSFKIILDWHHLEKKCKKRLSMGMKGKQAKNKAFELIVAFLWRGKVDLAIAYLRGLKDDDLKNREEIQLLIGYFERNRSFIPCYALRQKLGLRVSSNQVEKANDLVVSTRQKHNGMSWSTSGSTSLATVTSIHLNEEHSCWLLNRDITFQFKKPEQKAAA